MTGAAAPQSAPPATVAPTKGRFRTGLVAYSYQKALAAKTMTYEDLIRIAVQTGIDGIDLTSYWLPTGPADDTVLAVQRRYARHYMKFRVWRADISSASASLSRANALTASTVTLPILREGTETMRENDSASRGLKQKRM